MLPLFCKITETISADSNPLYSLGQIVVMLLLLAASAFFSGSETAFFSLSKKQRTQFKNSKHRLHKLTAWLTLKPARLLSSILFGNTLVNILFYAVATIFTARIAKQYGLAAGALSAGSTLAALILFAEMLPKSLAYPNAESFSLTAALPLYLTQRIFNPPIKILRFLIIEPALRILLGPAKHPKPTSPDEFKALVEKIRKRGLISPDEIKLMSETIELGFLKVRDCMKPRVDMLACDIADSQEKAGNIMIKNNITKLPIYTKNIDNILGIIYMRQLLLNPEKPLNKLVQNVHFVPEQKTVVSLLEFFRNTHSDTTVVVDEYGGIAGVIRLEDIAEELLGPIEKTSLKKPIQKIGPFRYRLAAGLSLHDWLDIFGLDPAETKFSTIGGMLTGLLGHIPKEGDVVKWKNLKLTVEKTEKYRIVSIILTIEQIKTNDS